MGNFEGTGSIESMFWRLILTISLNKWEMLIGFGGF